VTSEVNQRRWDIYQFPSSFVLGFHGCDEAVGEAVLRGEISHLKSSENDYDWLGTGIYFWEGNPQRALEFATARAKSNFKQGSKIKTPFVIGAILNMGRCLDLRDSTSLCEVREAYDLLQLAVTSKGLSIPKNLGRDMKLRKLDCAVINFLHDRREGLGWSLYDTVRADFWEGADLYPGAGFREQDHIQICVRNTDSILGYFRPIE
jgi:hypothetical protein